MIIMDVGEEESNVESEGSTIDVRKNASPTWHMKGYVLNLTKNWWLRFVMLGKLILSFFDTDGRFNDLHV